MRLVVAAVLLAAAAVLAPREPVLIGLITVLLAADVIVAWVAAMRPRRVEPRPSVQEQGIISPPPLPGDIKQRAREVKARLRTDRLID